MKIQLPNTSPILLGCLCLLMVSTSANAATIFDEATDGDLVDAITATSPGQSVGTLALGSNVVLGTFGESVSGADTDTLTFEIAAGMQLDSIDLSITVLSGTQGGGSYYAIQAGSSIGTSMATVGNNLSNTLVAGDRDLLADFAAGPFAGGSGLTAPLAAGQYTLWMSETAGELHYELDFITSAIPEPTTGMLGLLTLLGLASSRLGFACSQKCEQLKQRTN